ncbi:DgyrCDS3398 [Dimorphilus gyrociliatus]|uniref:DgyrCDS3398 n=1 Tax=Dimorphilus gyrociliatus TaxID=2664684 RepID=A0A7I8VI64_9ANNE|nr:DgyrCDS3398 [Dimorphilus gyrociliatus]
MSQGTNWSYVLTLGNSIIGVSVLAMPYCFKQCGLLLGIALILGSALLTRLSCNLLLNAAFSSKKGSYEILALHAFGAAGKLCVEISIIGLLFGTCVAFHIVIGDLGPDIISKILGIENTTHLRTFLMILLGLCVALPMGLLRNVESLANISALSIGFYIVFVCYIFFVSFPNLWSSQWTNHVILWQYSGFFKCLPILSLAFGCQSQLFVMYKNLPEPTPSRMDTIVKNAINICTSVYLMVGYFGYVAFCSDEISGDVLVNFTPTIFSGALKLGFVLSVALSFPLVIFPCRASIYSLLFSKYQTLESSHEGLTESSTIPVNHFRSITIAIVLSTLAIGICVPNVEFILGLTGSTMGSMISFIFPALMFLTVTKPTKVKPRTTGQLVLCLGITVMLASTYVTLYSQDRIAVKTDDRLQIKLEEKVSNLEVPKEVLMEKLKPIDTSTYVEKKAEVVENEKRVEPPNPNEPILGEDNKMKEPTVSSEEMKRRQEKIEKEKAKQELQQDKEEAKKLIKELSNQQEEQKRLIDEQKEIIKQLKQHKEEDKIREEALLNSGVKNQSAIANIAYKKIVKAKSLYEEREVERIPKKDVLVEHMNSQSEVLPRSQKKTDNFQQNRNESNDNLNHQ